MGNEFFVVGVSHHTADLEKRERLAVPAQALQDELALVKGEAGLREAVIVSTCNRVEYYAVSDDVRQSAPLVIGRLMDRGKVEDTAIIYRHTGGDAIRHLFRVSASLDSMVVGEPQILGQMKDAFRLSEQAGHVGSLTDRCFTRSFGVAKRVRTETRIAAGSVSVSSVACDLAQKIFGRLHGRKVLLVGAGEMGESAAKSLSASGTILRVLNRSPERAQALALQCGGESRSWDSLTSELTTADVVITSTGSTDFIVTRDLMRGVVKARRQRPLFFIDISVPRNVDPEVAKMGNVFLYDVDDLQQVAAVNLAARKGACDAAEVLVTDEVRAFERWRRSLVVKPTIVALREQVREVIHGELDRTRPRLGALEPPQEKLLSTMADAMVNKLLHGPIRELKEEAAQDENSALVDLVRRLFGLDEHGEAEPAGNGAAEQPAEVVNLEPETEKERESA